MQTKTVRSENQRGAQFVSADPCNNRKMVVKCKYCGNVFSMWKGHYYRGSNPCSCLTKVLNHRLHGIWVNMKSRCYNTNVDGYSDYGARGIGICPEWKDSYKTFETWAFQNGYHDDLTIERIDVNQGYEPANCCWKSSLEQANNKRNNVLLVCNGYRTSLKRFCDCWCLNYKTITSYYYSHNRDFTLLLEYLCQKLPTIQLASYDPTTDMDLPLLPLTLKEE